MRNLNCSFTLAPMSDRYIELILGSLAKVNTGHIYASTGRMSTIYQGTYDNVLDTVQSCFAYAFTEGVHMTMEMTLTDLEDDSNLKNIENGEPLNQIGMKDVHFPMECKLNFYPEKEDSIPLIEWAKNDAKSTGVYKDYALRTLYLKGDLHPIFACVEHITKHCLMNYEHFALEIGCAVNSPTAE